MDLVRGGLVEAALEGRRPAERYVELVEKQAHAPSAFIHAGPHPASPRLGQLLFGERFEVLEGDGAFAFGRAVRDGCVGWVATAALGETTRPTHRVQSLRAFAYAEPDRRAPFAGPIALNALVSARTGQGAWLHDPAIGWLAEADLAPVGLGFEADAAAVALRFLGVPYLEGARDGVGLDGPGLVQQALYACGLACPRALDALRALGTEVQGSPERGDLVFWDETVGLALDRERVVTADPSTGVVVSGAASVRTLRRL